MGSTVEESYGDVSAVDTLEFGFRRRTGAFVITDRRPVIIDTGLSTGAEHILGGLAELGIATADVDAIILTHIHMDHAGGASFLVDRCENADVYCHQIGAPYLWDPEKVERLVTSVHRAVGDLADQYGTMEPIPRDRVTTIAAGDEISLGSRGLRVVDAPGHAPHQVALFDPETAGLFVADECGEFFDGEVMPTTPPPNFDLEKVLASLDRFRSLEPTRLFFPHFGIAEDAMAVIDEYDEVIQEWVASIEVAAASTDETSKIMEAVKDEYRVYGDLFDPAVGSEYLRMDVEGVLHYLDQD